MTARPTATRLAQAVLGGLWLAGVREVVLSPGSRSAPLAMALYAAERAGDVRLHVRVDERSAGFLALGLSLGSGDPVAVVTTSGTAVGNLLPAVMEAHHSGRRVIVLSADRPERLRDTGANQTTRQAGIFGVFAACHDLPPDATEADIATAVDAAVAAGGPTQLNLQFDGDLLPASDEADTWWTRPSRSSRTSPPNATFEGEGGGAPRGSATNTALRGRARAYPMPGAEVLGNGPRTVVVAGDDAGPSARLLAEAGNWPLLAEPTSGARTGRQALRTYRLLLATALRDEIERVVVVGHPTLSRPVTGLISDPGLEVVAVRGRSGVATDPGRVARHLDTVPTVAAADPPEWFDRWQRADQRLAARIDDAQDWSRPTGLTTARTVAGAVGPGTTLVVGSSSPVRDLDVMAAPWRPQEHRFVVGNRGLAGIDGMTSTAVGVALGRPQAMRTLAIMGDLTFIHDSNGLLIPRGDRRPGLTIVVVSDDGGSIFATLEQGDRRYAAAFERVFATPHGTDVEALCRARHTAYERVTDLDRLAEALTERQSGIRVLEVPVPREDRREEAARLRRLATSLPL
ncbi:2-succinyl-6-hydroxy-2,4-cyclohexadiene-1-carboxylate synthase [Intrasporangium chromatireducens Q5-1]|uniref:2-succinyl-5-enolpyruvyl-6-hydroxy-3-cyclohexene-1-carboxylate synthase n=1 Tax=Intrasporangium chromatireducens Q5-1 TaxID=584657 RepID=W9GI74_9MICO|nr:2-succinyl-5-enolpyruvyl-6-hydroxy-3-cyclohexene-1-carboxylic-acid synthase [Intrasporangium chromatireducens]EWT05800.1 2-succinyl-6-hydroxy-2,4-cyclohexadiene-1-carboxylate synthase [Intrasporangium chromatireducens Q5-1]